MLSFAIEFIDEFTMLSFASRGLMTGVNMGCESNLADVKTLIDHKTLYTKSFSIVFLVT